MIHYSAFKWRRKETSILTDLCRTVQEGGKGEKTARQGKRGLQKGSSI
jgi:hypothetical protein